MKFPYLYLEIIRYIHYIICSDYYCRRSTKRQMNFSRKGKMSFTDYIYAIIQNTKSSLPDEHHHDHIGVKEDGHRDVGGTVYHKA